MKAAKFSYSNLEKLRRKIDEFSGHQSVPIEHVAPLVQWIERYGMMVDSLLNHCGKDECMECAKIVCPYGEPLHLHHDGCPACAMEPDQPKLEDGGDA